MSERGQNKLVAPDGDLEMSFDNIERCSIKSYCVSASEYKISRVFTTGIHIKQQFNSICSNQGCQ